MRKLTALLCALLCACSMALAAGHGEPAESSDGADLGGEPEVSYYSIKPEFTTNTATMNPRERPHYLRVQVSLMLGDSNDVSIITEMEPLLKDAIVTILGSKDISVVSSNQGREKIRVECRDRLVAIMNDKIGRQVIDDVLFLSYIYQ